MAIKYRIYREGTLWAGAAGATQSTADIDVPPFNITGQTPGASNDWTVRAYDTVSAIESDDSSPLAVEQTGGGITPVSAIIGAGGGAISVTFSESITNSGYVTGDMTATGSVSGTQNLAYNSGSPGTAILFVPATTGWVYGETVTLDYTTRANGLEATTGGEDVASFAGFSNVTNNVPQPDNSFTESFTVNPASGGESGLITQYDQWETTAGRTDSNCVFVYADPLDGTFPIVTFTLPAGHNSGTLTYWAQGGVGNTGTASVTQDGTVKGTARTISTSWQQSGNIPIAANASPSVVVIRGTDVNHQAIVIDDVVFVED